MTGYTYERPVIKLVYQGLGLKKRLLHVIPGPRQVGKTTAAMQIASKWNRPISLSGLEMFKQGKNAKRGSSPKLILWNNGLISAILGDSFEKCRTDYSWWGRLIENAVGAHLLNHFSGFPYEVHYWREREQEVDFILKTPNRIWAVEVKSGKTEKGTGLSAFCRQYPKAKPLIVGTQGMGFEDFFKADPKDIFSG